jgi:YidC/Oxa1 family membrane protein insertase
MMEDQGRRLLLAVAAAFAIMLLWSVLFPPDGEDEPPGTDEAGEVAGEDGAGDADGVEPGDADAAGDPLGSSDTVVVPRGPEKELTFESDSYRAVVSTYGATLKSWTLLGRKFEDRTKEGHPPMELVPTGTDESARQFDVSFTGVSSLQIPKETEWVAERKSDDEIWFTWDSSASRSPSPRTSPATSSSSWRSRCTDSRIRMPTPAAAGRPSIASGRPPVMWVAPFASAAPRT